MPDQQQQQPQETGQPQTPPAAETAPTWETWLESAPEDVRKLYDSHVTGLKSALSSEREQRAALSKQMADTSKKLEEGSEARAQLEKLSAEFETARKRADFFEALPADVVSGKLAWLAAQEADAWKRDGSPDWETLRVGFPELFRKPTAPPANAGAGTESRPSGADMNAFIRRAAGRT